MQQTTDSPRERVARAIELGLSDYIPKGELCIDDAVVRTALNCHTIGFQERLAFCKEFNLDIYVLSPVYPTLDKKIPLVEECQWQDIDNWTKHTSLYIFALLDGAFEWGLRMYGLEQFFTLLYNSPLAAQEFIDSIEKLNIRLSEILAERGVSGIIIADDIAYNQGLMLSPRFLRKFFFPSLSRQVRQISQAKLPAFFHSDGDYRSVLPDIVASGFGGLHCLDRNAGVTVADVRNTVGNRLCLWGHLDMQNTNAGVNSIALNHELASIRELAQAQKFILGTNSGIFAGLNLAGLRNLYNSLT
ncbi:MAG: hypothetical protein M0Z55_11310 [Peptococcaceae bacterium]|nr:hypothetical protein [Peptococcaceae bacterium]